ncbi:methionine--tRNA ligase [bacterium]|nr:methionine--tRNA ligase [bacterium]
MSDYYITTPIYYVNSNPHIGTAYTTILADTAARYHRLLGEHTYFLTGTDEHGDKIAQSAAREGTAPKVFVDRISQKFRDLWPLIHTAPDRFIRTTDEDHLAVVKHILQRLYDKGDIYFGEYGGNYCTGCERFLTDTELVDGKCPDHQTKPEYVKESNYFFRMSNYQEWLIDYIKQHPDFIRPERYRNEVLGFLREPLEDLCISRPKTRLEWGIEIPFDKDYVVYVWFDALLNYLTGIGYDSNPEWSEYWVSAEHLIGKDILKPHGIYWPTMLHAAGIDMFQHLTVHGYWNFKDSKISKSSGKPVDILPLVAEFGADAVRYFLIRDMVVGLDASFSISSMVKRINSDLANDLGNLFSRVAKLIGDHFEGKLPESKDSSCEPRESAASLIERLPVLVNEFSLHTLIEEVLQMVRATNRYFESNAPWKLVKTNKEAAGTVLHNCAEALRIAAVLLHPVMPERTSRLLARMGEPTEGFVIDSAGQWGRLRAGTRFEKGDALFPRIDEKELPEKIPDYFDNPQGTVEIAETENIIEIADFSKIDLQVAKVISAEKLPQADKLLKLQIRIGTETRQIIAGIAEYYSPEQLIDKLIIVVANLKPTKLRGEVSQGMLLAAKAGGKLVLVTPDGDIPSGAKVG